MLINFLPEMAKQGVLSRTTDVKVSREKILVQL